MRNRLTDAAEDYLKAIYHLNAGDRRASTNEIAEKMKVAPASVTGMLQKLASTDPPLVDYQKHQGAVLTDRGLKIALELIRHHRLLELFLHEQLGFSWDQVHSEADRLEHVISEELEDRLAQILGDPLHDPHGEPIPTRNYEIATDKAVPLSTLRGGQQAAVVRVETENSELLRYLAEVGLTPGARLEVQGYSPFDENLHLLIANREQKLILGSKVSRQVFVLISN